MKLIEEQVPVTEDEWCCMYRVLSLQDDFRTKKLQIQSIIEEVGHICLFLPQFHCELNPIGMLWSFCQVSCVSTVSVTCGFLALLSHHSGYWDSADGTFPKVRILVPESLDMCTLTTIRQFFQKSWRYLNAYRYVLQACMHSVRLDNALSRQGLNVQQAMFTNKKYKSHQRVGLLAGIIASLAHGV